MVSMSGPFSGPPALAEESEHVHVKLCKPSLASCMFSQSLQIQFLKRTLYSEKNMNSLNVEYFLAMNIQNLDKNG